jgi:chloramphenicol 3-O phosphotransferase
MARAGARIIVDEAFLGGAASQERLGAHLEGHAVLRVEVRFDSGSAAGREGAQAAVVHEGSSLMSRSIPARVSPWPVPSL